MLTGSLSVFNIFIAKSQNEKSLQMINEILILNTVLCLNNICIYDFAKVLEKIVKGIACLILLDTAN